MESLSVELKQTSLDDPDKADLFLGEDGSNNFRRPFLDLFSKFCKGAQWSAGTFEV